MTIYYINILNIVRGRVDAFRKRPWRARNWAREKRQFRRVARGERVSRENFECSSLAIITHTHSAILITTIMIILLFKPMSKAPCYTCHGVRGIWNRYDFNVLHGRTGGRGTLELLNFGLKTIFERRGKKIKIIINVSKSELGWEVALEWFTSLRLGRC